jgi:hypothetical protein
LLRPPWQRLCEPGVRTRTFSSKALPRKPMIPRSWPPRLPNLASSCGARSDRIARSANMPSCRRTYPSTRWRRDQQSLERRQKHRRLRRSTTKQPARPPLRSRENRSGAIASAGRKRPRGRRNASGASRPSQRPKQRLKKPSVTMKSRSKKSKETALHSTDGRKRRTRAGKSRRRNWKPLCAGRATSYVAMSQDARRVDPSVVPGARPAPSPGFIETCRPALREEAPSADAGFTRSSSTATGHKRTCETIFTRTVPMPPTP